MIQKLPITTVRNELRDIIDNLYANAGVVIIERNTKPMAALINYKDYLRIRTILLTLPEPSPAH